MNIFIELGRINKKLKSISNITDFQGLNSQLSDMYTEIVNLKDFKDGDYRNKIEEIESNIMKNSNIISDLLGQVTINTDAIFTLTNLVNNLSNK